MPHGTLLSTGSAGQSLNTTYQKLSGFNNVLGLQGMTANSVFDEFQLLHDGFHHISASLQFHSTGTASFTFHVYKNEAPTLLSTEQTTLANTTNVSCSLSGILDLEANDYISIRAISSVANQVLVLNNSQFTINSVV